MKNLTDVMNENETLNTYTYVVNAKVRGTVLAHNEGEAGELVDKEIDELGNYTQIDDYVMESLDAMPGQVQNEELSSGDDEAEQVYQEIIQLINERTEHLAPYYKAMVYTKLRNQL